MIVIQYYMDQNQLKENLLQKQIRTHSLVYPPYRSKQQLHKLYHRLTESCLDQVQLDQYQQKDQQAMYQSNIERRPAQMGWSSQQLYERSLLIQENKKNNQEQSGQKNLDESVESLQKINYENRNVDARYLANNVKLRNTYSENEKKRKELNMRIFGLSKNTLIFLYYFNLIFNLIFRVGLAAIVTLLVINQTDNDVWLIGVLVGLELAVCILYIIAINKLLYTKSSEISVYFQKQFSPEKHYDQINMDRLMRKHFTLDNMCRNLNKFLSPFTSFRKNIKISVLRQQFFKRMQFALVFIPMAIIFSIDKNLFDFDKEKPISEIFIATIFCCELIRICLHYLIIYINS